MASSNENEVRWETIDYGEAAFHVIWYRREDGRLETPRPGEEAAEPPRPGPILTWPLFRCWVAGRCG